MSVKQISVFLENKPGTLNAMTEVLSKNNIDIRAFSLAESSDFGIARLIVDDAYEAGNVLKDAGFVNSLTPVLAAEIPDRSGGLNKLLQIFTEGRVNVEYMYASLGGAKSDKAYMIFRVTDTKAAEAALTGKGVRLLDQEDVAGL